ncbi:MAG: glycosyltransferase [Bacteroidales bacterium]|nr:glycosyltransferase [Bacteroidales bacterium]
MIEALYQSILQNISFAALFFTFLFVLIIQLFYFWIFFSRLAFAKQTLKREDKPPVSVIIVANNQYEDLRKNLPEILNQDYPNYEVVVVNENSEDGSDELLDRFSEQYSHLRIVEMKQSLNWFKGRKFPLSIGIKSGKHDILLLTDIRCRPISSRWISEIVAVYGDHTEIVVGYSTFHTLSKINLWFRFAAFYDGLLYLSMALARSTFKGIGRNLSYRKTLFYNQNGFSSHYTINAGDDELFINKAATSTNVQVQTSLASMVEYTKPMSFSQWLSNEKTRLSTRSHFKFWHRIVISLFSTSTFLFYLLFVLLLILNLHWPFVVGLFLLRLVSQLIIFGNAQKKLFEKKLLMLSPFLEILLMFIDLFIWFRMMFVRQKKWN